MTRRAPKRPAARGVARAARTVLDRRASSARRLGALEALAAAGTAEALLAVARRFSYACPRTIEDEQEKARACALLIAAGPAAVQPLERYARQAARLAWPLRAFERVASPAQHAALAAALLDAMPPGDARDPSRKRELLAWLGDQPAAQPPALVPQLAAYLADPEEEVCGAAARALARQAPGEPSLAAPLLAALLDRDEGSSRLRRELAEVLVVGGWAVDPRAAEVQALLDAELPELTLLDGKLARRAVPSGGRPASGAAPERSPRGRSAPRYFEVMVKPAGPRCNLTCDYCFYREKRSLWPAAPAPRMSRALLATFTRQLFESCPAPEVRFAWQGGEPTLLGVEFFREVVRLQRELGDGRRVTNALQTNGTLIDAEWARFLREHGFLVGVSIDGPGALHDAQRHSGGRPSLDRTLRGLEQLLRHDVEVNALTVVSRHNADHPLEVYRFLCGLGLSHLQLIPLVERLGAGPRSGPETPFAGPPRVDAEHPLYEGSVAAEQLGAFLVAIFDAWLARDVGRIFVQTFETAVGKWLGVEAGVCVFAETCGASLILEHDGSLYACDHYVYPEHRLGNISEQHLAELAGAPRQLAFGLAKRDGLPAQCRGCDVLFACRGGCPKHRFARTADGEPGLSYLCGAYRRFYRHAAPALRALAELVRRGRPAAEIMQRPSRPPREA